MAGQPTPSGTRSRANPSLSLLRADSMRWGTAWACACWRCCATASAHSAARRACSTCLSLCTGAKRPAARGNRPVLSRGMLGCGSCAYSHCSTLWKHLFGRQARDLEQSNTAEDEYMISDSDLFVTRFVSVPREMGHFNPAAFVAGVVRGALDGAGFPARCSPPLPLLHLGLARGRSVAGSPSPTDKVVCCRRRVTAHYVPVKEQARPKTVILMKFVNYQAIMQREKNG